MTPKGETGSPTGVAAHTPDSAGTGQLPSDNVLLLAAPATQASVAMAEFKWSSHAIMGMIQDNRVRIGGILSAVGKTRGTGGRASGRQFPHHHVGQHTGQCHCCPTRIRGVSDDAFAILSETAWSPSLHRQSVTNAAPVQGATFARYHTG